VPGLREDDVINKYLIDIKVPRDSMVPLEVYIAFPKSLEDEEVREKIRKLWLYGNDKQTVSMDLMFRSEMECVFRPVGLLIDWKTVSIYVHTPSGLNIYIPAKLLEMLGDTTEKRIENLNDYLHIRFKKEGSDLVATSVLPLRGKIMNDIATEILENTSYQPIDVLVIGLGYEPNNEVKRLFCPRLLSWFKGFDGRPLHIAQFTPPESGKTSFGLRCETLFNWRYIAEPPTLARLVLDARTGVLGEVFLRNGLVFDEFDKWDVSTADRQHTFYTILTGMEQGKWTRGVSAMGVRAPDIPRFIPVFFFGNIGDWQKYNGVKPWVSRAIFNTIYQQRMGQDVSALCDRIAWIDVCYREIKIMDYLTYKVLPDGVIRGLVEHIQRNVKPVEVSALRGRLGRHANNVYAVLSQLLRKVVPEKVDAVVSGVVTLDEALKSERKAEEELEKHREMLERG